MPWYFHHALRQLFPQGRRMSFFSAISILGVALGVTLLIVSMSVMGGFGHEIRKMIVDTQGEVQVRANGYMPQVDAVRAAVARVPGVAAVTPFAEGMVMLEYNRTPAFPAIRGIDLASVEKVTPLERFMLAGSIDNLDDDSVILSSKLAASIGARVGGKVAVYSPLLLEKLKNDEVLLPRELDVVGIFEVGHQQLDSSVVLGTLRLMQDLYGLGSGIHGLNIKTDPGANPDRVARDINRVLPVDGRAATWMEANQDFLFVLRMEKNMIFFLLFFIVIVAAFSMASSLLVAVVRKTREVGLLSAMGGKPREIAACFCLQGLIIGVAGAVGGIVLGFTALHYRDAIIGFFTRVTGGEQALLNAYQFSRLPAHLAVTDFVAIVIGTIVVSTLAGLLPAWRAARLNPVEALRSE